MDNSLSITGKRGIWIDVNDNIRSDCIDCGKEVDEGNRCFECWEKAGEPCKWSCYDTGKLYKPKKLLGEQDG